MPSETIQPFGHLTFKSETHDTSKSSPVSTKESDNGTTFILHCKSEPDSFYESTMLGKSVTSPQTGDSESGLLVSGPVGGNLMLYMADECNNKNEIVIMDDHSTFNPSSPDAPSPMSTTCSQSSMYSPSSPSVYSPSSPNASMGVPSPSCMTSGENSCDVMLFDEDTISSLASILEESDNDMRTSSDERTLKCPRTSLSQVHSPEARVPSSPRTNLNQQCVFNFGLATSNTQFIETNFSSVTSVNTNQLSTSSTRSSTRPSRTKKPAATTQNNTDSLVPQRKPTRTRAKKTQSLNVSLPSKQNGLELSIVVQPEKQHRARYLTEGSRGSVKDESQQGFPTLRLRGTREQVTLQVFVASDLPNRVRPHGYYQACKVTGRNTTPCTELDVEGTTVIEIQWKPNEDNAEMEIKLDCVGILKLRNADVEQRIGLTRAKRKNTAVRLVYRVLMDRPDGSQLTLQQMSSAICCTQPLGHPEIIKKSLSRCSVQGKDELFIIGKNFVNKHTCVKLQEVDASGTVTWEEECEVDKSLFHNTHIVCTTPKFRTTSLEEDAEVYLVVSSGPGKTSEQYGHPMYYYMPLAGNTMDNNNFVGSSSAIDRTDSEGSLQFGLTSLQMPPSQETTMESSLSAMDVLNNFGQETIGQFQAVTTSPSTAAAQMDTSQMQLTMAQLQQPVMTACVQLPTSQPATTLVQQVQTPAVTTTQSTLQLENLTSGLTQVTSSAQVQPTTLSSLLTPAHSPKPATVNMDALSQFVQVSSPQQIVQVSASQPMVHVSAPQPVVTSSPTLQMSPVVQQQQQLLQQIQQQQQMQHQQQQSQLLPAETLLQAAQSLQALQAQAVQMQALQPQVQAAAMQVSAQLQMHAAKLQEQLKQKEQQQVVQIQPQQMSQVGVSFADKLKAAAQMEVNQPGLLTKLAQQQQQQQNPITLNLPSVCSVLNIQ